MEPYQLLHYIQTNMKTNPQPSNFLLRSLKHCEEFLSSFCAGGEISGSRLFFCCIAANVRLANAHEIRIGFITFVIRPTLSSTKLRLADFCLSSSHDSRSFVIAILRILALSADVDVSNGIGTNITIPGHNVLTSSSFIPFSGLLPDSPPLREGDGEFDSTLIGIILLVSIRSSSLVFCDTYLFTQERLKSRIGATICTQAASICARIYGDGTGCALLLDRLCSAAINACETKFRNPLTSTLSSDSVYLSNLCESHAGLVKLNHANRDRICGVVFSFSAHLDRPHASLFSIPTSSSQRGLNVVRSLHAFDGCAIEFGPQKPPIVRSQFLPADRAICSQLKPDTVLGTRRAVFVAVAPLTELRIALDRITERAHLETQFGHAERAGRIEVFVEFHGRLSVANGSMIVAIGMGVKHRMVRVARATLST